MLLLSGGLDSVTLLHELVTDNWYVHSLIFDYGQVHGREIGFARMHCEETKTPYTVLELKRLKGLFQHCALTDGAGGIIVPNRNAVFLNIGAGIAVSAGAESLFIACNQDDYEAFPDCRPKFFAALQQTLLAAEVNVEICTPYLYKPKYEIVAKSRKLGVNLDRTWSCYSAGPEPCGECLACQKRREACA